MSVQSDGSWNDCHGILSAATVRAIRDAEPEEDIEEIKADLTREFEEYDDEFEEEWWNAVGGIRRHFGRRPVKGY